VYSYIEQLTRTMLPLMEQTGVAAADEVDADDGLAERIRADALACDATLVLPPLVGAWAHKPDA
jgi:hypothetical protein